MGKITGEICFNTSITGYQEIITDPSYSGQIINFTFQVMLIKNELEVYFLIEKFFMNLLKACELKSITAEEGVDWAMSKFSYTRLVADMSDLYKRLLKST